MRVSPAGRDSGPTGNRRHADAALEQAELEAAERRVPPAESGAVFDRGAVVALEKYERVLAQPPAVEGCDDAADAVVHCRAESEVHAALGVHVLRETPQVFLRRMHGVMRGVVSNDQEKRILAPLLQKAHGLAGDQIGGVNARSVDFAVVAPQIVERRRARAQAPIEAVRIVIDATAWKP